MEVVYLPIHNGEQTEHGSQQLFIGQPNPAGIYNGLMDPQGISPLPVVPPRYPDRLKEILVEDMNFNPMQEVPLYQVHSRRGRQPMQYADQARRMQFRDWAEARPAATQMHCGRGWTDATESVNGIRCSRSVEETSQFPEQNQGGEQMRASSSPRQLTLNRSVYVLKLSQTHILSNYIEGFLNVSIPWPRAGKQFVMLLLDMIEIAMVDFRDGPLQNLWGGGEFSSRRDFFYYQISLYEFF